MSDLMTWLLLTLFGYAGIPTLLARRGFARYLRREAASRPVVALTFDDGPHPSWTPRVLEVLDRFGVKACFFMLGTQAAAHPDLVRQVVAAGHDVGVHGFKHNIAAFLGFKGTMDDVGATVRILTEITGKRPRYYRPPWGVFNLWTAMAAKRHGLVPVVWSLYVSEWSKSTTPAQMYTDAIRQAHPGMVLLLHDSAGPGSREDAPAVVLRMLPRLIAGLRRQGYSLVSLSQLFDSHKGGFGHAPSDRSVGANRP